jgi:hypothetical protein
VEAKARTPEQKARAKFFKRLYSFTVHAVNCLYSVYLQKDGTLRNVSDAVAMLRSIPQALRSLEALQKDPLVPPSFIVRSREGIRNLRAVTAFKDHKDVQRELAILAKRTDLPPALMGQIRILLGVKYKNILKNGSFEEPLTKEIILLRKGGKRDTAFASDGKYSFKSLNGGVHFTSRDVIPGKTYIFLADVYASKVSGEGRFFLLTNPQRKGRNLQYHLLRDIRLTQGWQTLSNTFTAESSLGGADSILVRIWGLNFEDDEPFWIDNVRVYQLD